MDLYHREETLKAESEMTTLEMTNATTNTVSLRKEKQDEVRERIIKTAFTLYIAKGVGNVTFEDIAEEAKVGRRTIYRYFANKKELIQCLVDELSNDFLLTMTTQLTLISDNFYQLLEGYIIYLAIEGPKDPSRAMLDGTKQAIHSGEFYFSSTLLYENWKKLITEPFNKAVANGEIRADIKMDQLLEWIGRLILHFIQFPKKEHELRKIIQTFVLPALRPN
jgi:AcrR family transcriptional regulator